MPPSLKTIEAVCRTDKWKESFMIGGNTCIFPSITKCLLSAFILQSGRWRHLYLQKLTVEELKKLARSQRQEVSLTFAHIFDCLLSSETGSSCRCRHETSVNYFQMKLIRVSFLYTGWQRTSVYFLDLVLTAAFITSLPFKNYLKVRDLWNFKWQEIRLQYVTIKPLWHQNILTPCVIMR